MKNRSRYLIDLPEPPPIGSIVIVGRRTLILDSVVPYTRQRDGEASCVLHWIDLDGTEYTSGIRSKSPIKVKPRLNPVIGRYFRLLSETHSIGGATDRTWTWTGHVRPCPVSGFTAIGGAGPDRHGHGSIAMSGVRVRPRPDIVEERIHKAPETRVPLDRGPFAGGAERSFRLHTEKLNPGFREPGNQKKRET